MKRPGIIVIIASVLLVILFWAALERVPQGQQALVIDGNRVGRVLTPGTHFTVPFSRNFVTYPHGPVATRFPKENTITALTRDGYVAAVSLELRLEVPPATTAMYNALGSDFYHALQQLVRDVVEIQTAQWDMPPGEAYPPEYASAVAEEITREFGGVGVRVNAYRITEWQVEGGEPVSIEVADRPLRKVIFVGVDGGDWEMIDELIAEGRLPNFKRLVNGGARGPLQSIEPLLSPLLWTTMATGKLPEDHGILNFTVPDPKTGKKVPISRAYRKVDAFWNILSDYDRRVDIVGWLATYPAESINGVMVTDRVGYLAFADANDDGKPSANSISPEARVDEIAGLVKRSTDVTHDEFSGFANTDVNTFLKNRSTPFDPKNPINNMIMLYASTESYRRMAMHLLDEDSPDFLGVYFELVDATGHLFMHYAAPKQAHVDEEGFRAFGNAVVEAYETQDRILGDFLDRLDDETVLVIASDHGFKSGSSRPKLRPEIWAGKAASWHKLNGIVCFYGNGIKAGHRITNASILDITPTILALQGLPKPADMPGKVLDGPMDDALRSQLNDTPVATFQRKRDTSQIASAAGDASTDEALKKLEALGYLTPDNPDAHNNLGQRYAKQGELEKAIAEFEKALAINPNFPSALVNIGMCYGRLKRYEEAETFLKKALSLKPDDVYAMNNLAVLYLESGNLDLARRVSEQSIKVEPNYANGHLTLGSVYATMGELDRAEQEFLKTLEIDPTNRSASINLQKVRSARGTE